PKMVVIVGQGKDQPGPGGEDHQGDPVSAMPLQRVSQVAQSAACPLLPAGLLGQHAPAQIEDNNQISTGNCSFLVVLHSPLWPGGPDNHPHDSQGVTSTTEEARTAPPPNHRLQSRQVPQLRQRPPPLPPGVK